MDFRKILSQKLLDSQMAIVEESELVQYTQETILPHQSALPTLYRFSPADYNNIRALETQTLYLSECGKMNDLFEGASCIMKDIDLKDLRLLQNAAFLKSFTETRDEVLMWSQYADNFQGMCVAYDFSQCKHELLSHLFPVVYTNQRKTSASIKHIIKELEILQHDLAEDNYFLDGELLPQLMPLFLTKSCAWEREKEWRLLVTLSQKSLTTEEAIQEGTSQLYEINEQIISVPFITDVYLGPVMPEHKKKHIREICERLKIHVHDMILHPTEYRLQEK